MRRAKVYYANRGYMEKSKVIQRHIQNETDVKVFAKAQVKQNADQSERQTEDGFESRESWPSVQNIGDQQHKHTCQLDISIFASKALTKPIFSDAVEWSDVVSLYSRRESRSGKDGWMMGAYAVTGSRCNENVTSRSLLQLDIDTKGEKDNATGRVLRPLEAAPTLSDIRAAINEFEWVAASSHWHEPKRGVIKYRIVMLPDRDIQPDEYKPVLEALTSVLAEYWMTKHGNGRKPFTSHRALRRTVTRHSSSTTRVLRCQLIALFDKAER